MLISTNISTEVGGSPAAALETGRVLRTTCKDALNPNTPVACNSPVGSPVGCAPISSSSYRLPWCTLWAVCNLNVHRDYKPINRSGMAVQLPK
jgi:hypothetical protein